MSEQQNNGQRRNQSGNRNNNRNRNNNNRSNNNRAPRKREPKPLVLSGWQKFLKAIGLFNEEKARKAHQQANKVNKALDSDNARNAHREKKSEPKRKESASKSSKSSGAKPRRATEKVPVETPRLYVGNLSYDASDSDIEELFKGIGNVKNVEIIYNRHTHRSKGYGFVQMFNTDDAKRAVEVLHDQPFLGRNLIVNGSKARNPDDPAAQENSDNAETADSSGV